METDYKQLAIDLATRTIPIDACLNSTEKELALALSEAVEADLAYDYQLRQEELRQQQGLPVPARVPAEEYRSQEEVS